MPIAAGTRFGSYEVARLIDAGGMGEVYRARDVELGRDVALKVLPAFFTSDANRVARFEQEAKTLASLDHANIAHIYGLERSEGTTALAIELVDGPTLAERITHGRLPVEEALRVAIQIADGLAAAHERGIVHRDLKPANIKLKADGTAKVLDFGIAKVLDPRTTTGPGPAALTTPAMTEAGVVLGTAAYMSPEQARGRPVDQRTDIWAFGCVLYEMLTGHRAFEAETVSETLAAVLRSDVDWSLLPDELPPIVRAFLVRCLHKDPAQRVHHMADVGLALEGAFDTGVSGSVTAARAPSWRHAIPIAAALIVGVGITGLTLWPRTPAVPIVTRLQVTLPPHQPFYFNGRHLLAISPDGTRLAYTAGQGLWLHPLDQIDARPVPGAEDEARGPFFSRDGQSIGYYAAGELRRVSVTGGAPVTIAKVVNPWGASWADDGMIYYGQGPDGIWRVPASGGTGERLIVVKEGEQAYGPHLLPDRKSVLFTLLPAGVGSWNRAQIVVQSLTTGERVVLVDGGRDARYVDTGHLVYALNGSILAAPFDASTRRVTGGAVPLVNDVFDAGTVTGAVHFDIADNGSLVYAQRPGPVRLTWVDRNGKEELIPAEPRRYRHPRVSPDGTRIAVEIDDPNNTDVWVGDARRGTFTRLTSGGDVNSDPIWTRDGSRIVYSSVRGTEGLFWQRADGSGQAEHLVEGSAGIRACTWTSDGQLVYEELVGTELRLLTPDGPAPPRAIKMFESPNYFNERLPALSPDGHWVAYQSTESGEPEVYLRPFPDVSSLRRQVSLGGGFAPLWAPNGREIYYRSSANLMAVKVQTSPTLELGTPEVLFSLDNYVLPGTRGIKYDVAPDGRFLLLKDSGTGGSQDRVVLVQNWTEELKRRVRAK
jgi:hypothetical protein